MKKRVLSIFLTMVIVIGFIPGGMLSASAAASGNGWSLDDDGLLTIENDVGMADWIANGRNSSGNIEAVREVVIQDGVISIGLYAFDNCAGLTEITIPDSVTSIGGLAFANCAGLTEITIPDSVISIGGWAFSVCTGLTSVTFKSQTPPLFGSFVFDNVPSSMIVYVPLGAKVAYETESELSAFKVFEPCGEHCKGEGECDEPCKRIIASGVDWTLDEDGLLIIESDTGMTDWIDNGRNSSGNIEAVREVVIQDDVTSIGGWAFSSCTGLTSATFKSQTPPSFGSSVFVNVPSSMIVYVPIGAKAAYETESELSAFKVFEPCGDHCKGEGECDEPCKRIIASGVDWTLDEDGLLVIESDAGMTDWTNNGRSVSANRDAVLTVVIQDGVTSISTLAFYDCTGLTSVTIGNKVESIGNNAFAGCAGLTEIIIPDSVTSIDANAFTGCAGLTEITIPDSVTSIGDYAFHNCTGLTSVTIGNKVESIGEQAFNNTGLTEIKVSAANQRFADIDGVLFNKNATELIRYPEGRQGSYEIPDSVTSIGDYAFHNCTGLTEITIPDSVISIGREAFFSCTGLTEITIPDSVTSIGDGAFYGCRGLTEITIPDSVTSIGDFAFYNCTGLTNVSIPDSVTSIGFAAFFGCTGLTEIKIPDSVTSIGGAAFYNCTGLTSVTFDSQMPPLLGTGVFYDVSTSMKIYVPKGAIEVYEAISQLSAFNIVEIFEPCGPDCKGEGECDEPCERIIASGIDWKLNESGLLIIESDTGMTDWTNNGRSVSANRNAVLTVVIQDGVTSISTNAFLDCTELTSVTIGNKVESIGAQAFFNCTGLTEIKVSAANQNFTDIDGVLFNKNATELIRYLEGRQGSYTIPDSVTSIGGGAFYNCKGLTSVTIGNKVESIGDFAFSVCTGLTEITIPDSVTSIGEDAFSGCTGLTEIKIPDSVTSIGFAAFYGCAGLASVTFKSHMPPLLGDGVFYNVSTSMIIYVPKGAIEVYEAISQLSAFNIVEIFEPCGEDCKGEGNCDDPCEPPPEYALGDCNNDGRINIADLTYLKWAIVKMLPETPECFIAGKDTIGAADITLLRNFLTGKISSLR
ncbi:MAG: leucine-rich repeat protein [Oscillospiraceae bacterium]|nr:leucine-rich repeat protein [Oscillospiraceae bacterium]